MSFIGLLSIGGMALAVAVLIAVLSVVNGFERELRERVLGVLPHGTVYTRGSFDNWSTTREMFLRHDSVIGVAPTVEGSGLLVAEELVGVRFSGIDPEFESSVSILPDYMEAGGLQALESGGYGVVVGAELADQLGVSLGEKITLVLPMVTFNLSGPVLTSKRLTVVGIFRVGADLDKHQLFVHLSDAQKLKRQSNIDGLVVKTNDLYSASEVLHEIVLNSGMDELFAISWMRRHGNLYEAIQTQKATLFFLLMILISVAAFNVVSNLVMTVDDNKSEIAILRTMGASPHDIRLIFTLHGMMVGMIGLALGVLLGLALTLSLSSLFLSVSDFFGLNLMGEYFIRYLPTDIQIADILTISGVCLVISMFATLYPASKAANSNPVEALQYEI